MYIVHYLSKLLPHFFSIITLGFIGNHATWQLQITFLTLSLFWLIDLLPILLSFGKITSVWHCRAENIWFETDLFELAAGQDRKWLQTFAKSFASVLFLPEVI